MANGNVVNKIQANNKLIAEEALKRIRQRASDLRKKQASEADKENERHYPPIVQHRSA